MEEIIQFDKQLLLMVNGSDSVFLDYVVLTLTNAKTWIPLYLGLFYVVLMTHKPNWRDILLILAAAGLCVLLAGTINDTIVKPLVARWRPTHDPEIGMLDLGNHRWLQRLSPLLSHHDSCPLSDEISLCSHRGALSDNRLCAGASGYHYMDIKKIG